MGRPAGSTNKRTEEGRDFVRVILVQNEDEFTAFGVEKSPSPNLVVRRLREQARAGVGSQPGLLPPAVYVHLMDRLFGKVLDRVKLAMGGKRPLEDLTNEELAERARLTAQALAAK